LTDGGLYGNNGVLWSPRQPMRAKCVRQGALGPCDAPCPPSDSAAQRWLKRYRYKRDHPLRKPTVVALAISVFCTGLNLTVFVLNDWSPINLGSAVITGLISVFNWRRRRG